MQIAGIQKITLVDFPGHVAATIFTRGCSFRCPFCHNPELVLPDKFNPLLSEKQIFDFLESRYGKLSGICVTGGEPLFQPDCDKFVAHLKALGFDVKLDTNGSFPERLESIIENGDIDYIAMDIKSAPTKYDKTVGTKISVSKIEKSIDLIMTSGIDYEFRTTVCHPLHEVADFEKIGEMIKGAKRYFIQNYKKTKQIDEESDFQSFSDKEIKEAKKIMLKYVSEVGTR
jgi:pyruvate formate lyase activating enzyme